MFDFEYFKRLPKCELHVHLEGSLQIERVLSWSRERGNHPWSNLSREELVRRFQTKSFEGFIENFMVGCRLLRRACHFQAATEDLCAALLEQGVVHAEVLYSPGVYVQKLGVPLAEIHAGITAGLKQFPDFQPVFILDTVLNLGIDFMETTLDMVLRDRPEFLGGFSVGGGDPNLDMSDFLPLFDKAQRAGLFCVAHAGEVDGPDNIKTLLANTDVKRIGHGCTAVQSLEVMDLLKAKNVAVDVCLTSNLRTGAVATLAHHPAKQMIESGIPITVNTDDPLYFGNDLFSEYALMAEWPEVTEKMVIDIVMNSIRHAVMPDAKKEALLLTIR